MHVKMEASRRRTSHPNLIHTVRYLTLLNNDLMLLSNIRYLTLFRRLFNVYKILAITLIHSYFTIGLALNFQSYQPRNTDSYKYI